MQKDLRRLLRDPDLIPSKKQELLTKIATQAAAKDMPPYLVGGGVRDLLLDKQVNDLDVVVEGDAIGLGSELVKKYGGKLTIHQKFRTCVWHLPVTWHLVPGSLDITTARSEKYEAPGTLPVVKPSVIEDDLRRRDFTINAIALRLDADHFGELLDPLLGQADLSKGLVRALHSRSFIDDPTRILRAIRYEQRYGFEIERDTLKLINHESLAVLSQLSGERIRHEFELIFEEDNSARMLGRAEELGIFTALTPELPGLNKRHAELLNASPPDDLGISFDRVRLGFLIWLAGCSEEALGQISRRLDFASEMTRLSLAMVRLSEELASLKGSKASRWTLRLDKAPELTVFALWIISGVPELKEYLKKWRHVKTSTTGETLKDRGLPPGPRYAGILARLRDAWLDGEVTTLAGELSLLDKLI